MTDPRRREPAINRALKSLGLPPLLTGDYDPEDQPPMSRDTARLIVAAGALLVLLGLLALGAGIHDHLAPIHLQQPAQILALS
jgi:hypothetical protein